jgi:hypothetical protein
MYDKENPMSDEIVPESLTRELMDSFLENMRQGQRMQIEMAGEDPDNLATRYVEHPLAPEFLTARAEFVARWEAMQQEGLDAGYLEWGHCYECGGPAQPTEATTEYRGEPNPDYDPDKPLPKLAQHVADGGTIQFTYATKTLDVKTDI